jgi:hypothetical protein
LSLAPFSLPKKLSLAPFSSWPASVRKLSTFWPAGGPKAMR